MLIEYHPDLLPTLADLHADYASAARGLSPFPSEHWESIFTRPDINPRRDVLIASRSGTADICKPAAFCWLFTKQAPSHVYLRGPFLSPDDPDLGKLLEELINKAIERAKNLGAGYIEGRSIYPAWVDAFKGLGFRGMGAYERWRLFPLKGTVSQNVLPDGGEIRRYVGKSDLPILMELFRIAFSSHWDYIPPVRDDWEDVIKGRQFNPKLVLLAFDKNKPVGYIFGETMPDYSSTNLDVAYLVSIGFDPVYQGRGWGSALISRWLRAVYDEGPRAVELDVDESNNAARALYRRFGFHRLRTEKVWRLYLKSD